MTRKARFNMVYLLVSANTLEGKLKEPLAQEPYAGRTSFITTRVAGQLAGELEQHGVRFAGRVESGFLSVLLARVAPTPPAPERQSAA
jgi:cell division protease FtsH